MPFKITSGKVILLATGLLSIVFFCYRFYFLRNTLVYNFASLLVPGILLYNLLSLIHWLYKNYRMAIIPALALLSGHADISATIQLRPLNTQKSSFSVMSYNVGTFNLDRFNLTSGKDTVVYVDTMNTHRQNLWLDSVKTDIVCFQEFYNNDFYKAESIISHMVKNGYAYYYTNPITEKYTHGFFGVIIFSRYPIIRGDSIKYSEPSLNRGVFADIVIKEDTIRVINIHLHSMSIRINPADYLKNFDKEVKVVKNKLKNGFMKRGEEIHQILELVKKSPYKVVLCGDFNDMPYAYSYQVVKKHLNNAFEDAGSGFGITYNKAPFYIRIDNQFYDKRIAPVYFKVLKNYRSDHFPIEAGYNLTISDP